MGSDFGSSTERRATKDHRCAICGLMIPRKSRYTRFKGKWEGDMQNWPAHTDCFANHDGGEVAYA